MNKNLKLGIELALAVVIVVLVYAVYHTVNVDIEFGEEKAKRQAAVIEKLQDARELQFAYEAKYNKYADSWEELIRFAKQDSLEFTYTEGDMEDSAAVAEGRAFQKKVKMAAFEKLQSDSLLSQNFNLDEINKIPGTNETFEIAASSITSGGAKIPTFQMGVLWDVLLHDLNRQLVVNAKEYSRKTSGYEGLRIGKIDEATTEGNWQ
ncbi:MAG: hypothetical protein IKO90_08755 [Bacteroidales bacterium]|nr:hypothetical protein [Bacteroidales bacterium]MBQ3676552.1 hypothetical protein [Bacteroidales bacterium]MBR4690539.1 hypothetical protein [Bacteroidales bacterium]MBR7034804.1 hypothetical protein [Bacteroidales bacterium]